MKTNKMEMKITQNERKNSNMRRRYTRIPSAFLKTADNIAEKIEIDRSKVAQYSLYAGLMLFETDPELYRQMMTRGLIRADTRKK